METYAEMYAFIWGPACEVQQRLQVSRISATSLYVFWRRYVFRIHQTEYLDAFEKKSIYLYKIYKLNIQHIPRNLQTSKGRYVQNSEDDE